MLLPLVCQIENEGEGEKSLLLTAVADIMNCYVVEKMPVDSRFRSGLNCLCSIQTECIPMSYFVEL